MIVLSHRGYWEKNQEKNTLIAFERSFASGFGTETDIRDNQGKLVTSHDVPGSDCLTADAFFQTYIKHGANLPLALNIKADGLQFFLKEMLEKYGVTNYFTFDTSVPDGLGYIKSRLFTFTRQSEYEKVPAFYEEASGVWLDEFVGHWIGKEIIEGHLNNNKKVCIVSPELHKREYLKEWGHYRNIEKDIGPNRFMLCTDFPQLAREFFCE